MRLECVKYRESIHEFEDDDSCGTDTVERLPPFKWSTRVFDIAVPSHGCVDTNRFQVYERGLSMQV